jgi:hypothetical protein
VGIYQQTLIKGYSEGVYRLFGTHSIELLENVASSMYAIIWNSKALAS